MISDKCGIHEICLTVSINLKLDNHYVYIQRLWLSKALYPCVLQEQCLFVNLNCLHFGQSYSNNNLHSFFLSYSGLCLPTHCRCRGLLSHAMTHYTREETSRQGIGRWRRPLPDNAQNLQETDIYVPAGFEPTFQLACGRRPKH
jgi:hypothetical protein